MEPANNDDFQPSTNNSHSRPKTRNKLSSKRRVKLQCKKEHDLEVLFSPVSHCFKRNASTFVANSVNPVCGEEDNSDPVESCISAFRKQTETTGNKYDGRSEQTINATMCFNSESASETRKKLNYSVSKSSLDSISVEAIQVAGAEGKEASANEECLQEFRNITKHGHGLTEASNDDAFNKTQCVSLVKLNGIETESALNCMNEVHISCEGSTRRHLKCPLCWKIFEKNQALVLHMKGCAARHNVTTQQLLNALELQERQAAERQALGLPDIPTSYTGRKSLKKSGKDGNLQLALALSASLQEAEDREQLEQDDCLLEAGLGHEVVEQQKLMWERFGFRRSNPALLAPSNSRHKSACKSKTGNPVLMRRTKEEREMLITEKVAIILMGEDSRPVCTAVNISHDTHLVDGLVDPTENLQKYQNKSCLLWNMASVSCSEKELESYYVKELTKFISPSKVPVGSKLKHLSQIPGRSKTPERDYFSPVTKIPLAQLMTGLKEETETAEHTDAKARQSFVASLTDESACKNSLAETLISDWKSVLNKKVMSDLTIYVEKDLEIPAHKLVLYVRCRAILKDVVSEMSVETNKKTSDMLLWVDVSYRAALAFLHFVYCGVTNKILHLVEGDLLNVKRLAERYHVSELLHYLRVVSAVRGSINKSRNSSLDLLVPHDSITDNRKHNSFHERNPSNQCASPEAVPSPHKQMYANNTFNSHDNSAELRERSVSSETDSKEFHESAVLGLCSRVNASSDLFIKDIGEPDVKPLTQEDISSMAYLINMMHQPSLSQSNTQVSSEWMSSNKLSQNNTHISSAEVSSDKLSQNNTRISSAEVSSDKLSQSNTQISSAEVSSDKLSQNNTRISSAEVSLDKLSQSNTQISSAEVSSDKLSQSNTQISSAEMSSDKLLQSNTQINSLQMPLDTVSQSNTQVSSSHMSSDKQSPTLSCAVHHSPSLQNSDAVSDCEVSRPTDMQISSVSQSHDNKCVSYDTNLMCVEHVYNNQNGFYFFSSPMASRNHTYTSDSVSNTSIVNIKAQRNSLRKTSVNFQQSSQLEMCSQLQPSLGTKQEIEKAFDDINFLEHLLSDPHTRTNSTCVQGDVKERVEMKRKHPESYHCSSYTKKICRDRVENESVKTLTIKSELNETSNKFEEFEKDVEVFDLTQSSTDSEFTEPQDPLPIPPVRESVVDTNIKSEKNSISSGTECTDVTICNNLLMKSEESKTSHETSECMYFDTGGETRGKENMTVGQQKESVEEETTMEINNKQISHEWDEFDEMCHASVPQIFSQCLSQLISSQSTAQKSLKSRTSSHKSEISHKNMSKSVKAVPSVLPTPKSRTVNEIMENSLLAQLNESVFWRDESAPTLSLSPKQAVMTDHGNILEHRTPIQKSATISFLDTVTPPADYSTMKTPQLKKELKKYGLKPSLTKRQAKTMLRYIYDQLHPYITVSDSEDDTQLAEMESSPMKKPGADTQVLRSPVRRTDILGTLRSPVRRNIMTAEVTSHRGNLGTERRRNTASQSDAGSDSDDLLSSLERSSSSEVTVTEEVFCEELDICSQGDICLSQDADLARVVHNFIISDPNLHQKVLLYEPIWIEQLHADLKANNFRVRLHQLMDYLDEQCITFRTAHGQHSRQKTKLIQEDKRQKSTKKKRKVSDRKLTSSSAVNSTNDR